MYQEYPQTKQANREIRFFSEIRKETYNLADVRKLSDEDIDFLLSEAWNTRVSLGLVSAEAHEKIAQGQVIDSRWLKRVKYKYKAVKAFMHGLREEKGLRYISQSPEIAARLREELIKNDIPESDSVIKIDATVNAVLSFRARELGTFMELVTKEIGNQRFQELRKTAAERAKLLGGQAA